jgi:serpin B
LKIAAGDYNANIQQADFKTSADAVTREINRWVAEKTNNKIQHILPPGSVDSLTRLVLANALYFKGAWASPFEEGATSTQPFHLSTNRQDAVPLMGQTAGFKYIGNNDFQAIELPYIGVASSMIILLPRHIDGCGQLENRLTPSLLSSTLAQMKTQKVELRLPRFRLECSVDLKETLAKMGMPDAFGLQADLSGLDGARDLFISGVFHKAWGEIKDEGTEAAAATAGAIVLCQEEDEPAPPVIFRADHPFIFLIRDMRSGGLLFAGRLAEPLAG